MIGDLDCEFPFNDCRRNVRLDNDGECVIRTKCQPKKYFNGKIKHFWCSTAKSFDEYSPNHGVCEESCPKEKD